MLVARSRRQIVHNPPPLGLSQVIYAVASHIIAHYRSACSPVQQATLLTEIGPVRLLLCVAAIDEIDGVERAIDRTLSPEEEAGQRHHLAATVGQERRDDQGHG